MKPNLVSIRIALLIGGLLSTVGSSPVHADQGGIRAQVAALQQAVQVLQQQVGALVDQAKANNTAITQLTAVVNSQSELIGQLRQQNQKVQTTLGCMSKTGNDVYFTACNLHVVSGSGATYGAVNGLGNLIIGYDEDRAVVDTSVRFPASVKTGSHNLVVGAGHSYTNYGGLVAGFGNSIEGSYASVSGGIFNTGGEFASSITGGYSNFAGELASSVSGGYFNIASGFASSASGGAGNFASGYLSSVSGGDNNFASGFLSSVSGGEHNTAGGRLATVSGGQLRTAPNDFNWAAGALLESQ